MKNFGAALVLFLLFSLDALSQFTRSTTFDDRGICEENKGVWREFGNGCVDECNSKFDQFTVCTYAITFGCDCGKGKCWNDKSCVAVTDYKKVFDAEQEKEQQILAEAKKKRQEALKENQAALVEDLVSKAETRSAASAVTGGSNNYSDFYNGSSTATSIGNAINSATNAGAALTDKVTAPTPVIPEAPPIIMNNPPATVPPLFLQQEKDKQKNQQAAPPTTAPSTPPTQALPVIPLPH